MANASPPPGGLIAGINVTPLVDVTLVLLIIFIVTAKIVVAPAVPLDLPKASSGQQTQVVFSLIIQAQGPTLVDGEPVLNAAELSRLARAARQRQERLRAVIHADGDVPHRRVMAVLDQLKEAGIAHVAFGVSPIEGAGAAP